MGQSVQTCVGYCSVTKSRCRNWVGALEKRKSEKVSEEEFKRHLVWILGTQGAVSVDCKTQNGRLTRSPSNSYEHQSLRSTGFLLSRACSSKIGLRSPENPDRLSGRPLEHVDSPAKWRIESHSLFGNAISLGSYSSREKGN